MSNAPAVNIDKFIRGYADHLAGGGRALSWLEVFNTDYYTPLEILEFLIESYILFSRKDSIINEADHLEAFDQVVHSCLQDMLAQLREGRSLAKEDWSLLQKRIEKALAFKQSDHFLLSRLIFQISDLGFEFSFDLMESVRDWMSSKIDPKDLLAANYQISSDELTDEIITDFMLEEDIFDEYCFFEEFSNQIAYLKLNELFEMFLQALHSEIPLIKESVVLFLLHAQPSVRKQAMSVLRFSVGLISELTLNRLIRIRNWLPREDMNILDSMISGARKSLAKVGCTDKVFNDNSFKLIKHLASSIDGSGSQNIISLFLIGKKFQLVGGVVKEKIGWIDLWSSTVTTRKEAEDILLSMRNALYTIEVSSDYIEFMILLGVSWNKQSGYLPSPLLMTWVERLALVDTNPQLNLNLDCFVNLLKMSPRVLEPQFRKLSLSKSKRWLTSKGFTMGWFEYGEITDAYMDSLLVKLETNSQSILDDHEVVDDIVEALIEPERLKWFQRFVHLAFWALKNTKKQGPDWEDFLVLAFTLNDNNVPLKNIPLMREIAVCTLSYFLPSQKPNA